MWLVLAINLHDLLLSPVQQTLPVPLTPSLSASSGEDGEAQEGLRLHPSAAAGCEGAEGGLAAAPSESGQGKPPPSGSGVDAVGHRAGNETENLGNPLTVLGITRIVVVYQPTKC